MGDKQALVRFEAAADLYYRRFGRLAPGKSEPAAMGLDSNDETNREQHEKWIRSGQALWDAVDRVADLESEVEARNAAMERLQNRLDTAEKERDRMAVRHIAGDQDMPDGWKPVEAWTDGKEVAIVGEPQDGHNCDQMGCGSVGPHVTNRCPLHAREKTHE